MSYEHERKAMKKSLMNLCVISTRALFLASLLYFGAADLAVAEKDKTIHFNYGVPTSMYPALYVAERLDLFEKHKLKPTFFAYQSGAPLISGLRDNSLDVVTTGLASVYAVGQGIPMKYIMWEGDPSQGEALVVGKSASIKSVSDLKTDSKLGAASGTCAQVSLYYAIANLGYEYEEYSIKNIAPPLFENAFRNKVIDAGIAWAPYSFALEEQGNKLIGFDSEWNPMGGLCSDLTLAHAASLEKHPELGRRLVAVHEEAVEYMFDNRDQTIEIVADKLRLDREVAARSVEKYFESYPSIQDALDPNSPYSFVGENGLIAKLSLASIALARLGVIDEEIPLEMLKEAVTPQYMEEYLLKGKGRQN